MGEMGRVDEQAEEGKEIVEILKNELDIFDILKLVSPGTPLRRKAWS